MKTSSIPAVRIEPELREQLEQVLQEGESLSAFVEASVRDTIRRRLDQAEFIKRGLASLAAARRSGQYVAADTVVRNLEERLENARRDKQHTAAGSR
jgi:predicted transcriptional regulator